MIQSGGGFQVAELCPETLPVSRACGMCPRPELGSRRISTKCDKYLGEIRRSPFREANLVSVSLTGSAEDLIYKAS